jgi:PHD/YefM family antitoxin component YafN of YafNO toxin-antitoxin module
MHLHDFFRQYLDNISEPSGTNTSLNTSPVVIVRRNSPANMTPTSAIFSPKIDTRQCHLHDYFLDNISEPSGTNTSLNTSPIVIVRRNSPANMTPTSANFSPKIDTPKVVHYANLQHFSQKRGVSAEPARSRMSFPPSK